MICHFARCSAVAWSSLGNHTRGTVIVRPSSRSTLNVSSSKLTSLTRSSGLTSEIVMPRLQQGPGELVDDPLDRTQLPGAEAEIPRKSDGFKPELSRQVIPIHMD